MASEIDLNALMSSLSCWEIAGYVSVAAVAIGVAGEFVHDFVPSFRIRSQWWNAWGGKVSGLVLIAALAAELIIQVTANNISGQIIAFLGDKTASANLRTAEIERVTAWRRIPEDAAAKLAKSLSLIPESIPHTVLFAYAQNDMESLYFAAQIGVVFMNLKGWTLHQQGRTYPGMLYWGVHIVGPDTETTRAIRQAFTDARIDFSTEDIPGGFQSYGHMAINETTILAGPKNLRWSHNCFGR